MNLRDYKVLNYLSIALENARLELDRIKGETEETINLSKVMVNIEEAKNIARSYEDTARFADELLVEKFEREIRKISGKRATKENCEKLERILLHLDAQVNMSKAVYGYTDEEYNKFLKLLEIEEVKKYLLSLRTRTSNQSFELILGLDLAKKDGDKLVLTERGSCLQKALKSLKLLAS
jgi:hypothetical protein